jgi:hypothetical protein
MMAPRNDLPDRPGKFIRSIEHLCEFAVCDGFWADLPASFGRSALVGHDGNLGMPFGCRGAMPGRLEEMSPRK